MLPWCFEMKPCTIPKEEDGNADHGYARGKYRLAIVVRLDFVQSPGHPKVKEEQGDDKSGARLFHFLGVITATFTGPRQTSLFPKAARPAAPCATYCYHAAVANN